MSVASCSAAKMVLRRMMLFLWAVLSWHAIFSFRMHTTMLIKKSTVWRPSLARDYARSDAVHSGKETFAGVVVPPPISTALKRLRIIDSPSPIQRSSIPTLCSGLSCLLHAPTGSGKTYAFLLPILKKIYESRTLNIPLQALILVPTFELVHQIREDIFKLTNGNSSMVYVCNTNITSEELVNRFHCPIWIGTPYKVSTYIEKGLVGNLFRNLEFLVLDEVDRLLICPSNYMSAEQKQKFLEGIELPTKDVINDVIKAKVVMEQPSAKGPSTYKIEPFQVIGASATIGRSLRRDLFRLFNVEDLAQVTDPSLRKHGGSFPVIRPLPVNPEGEDRPRKFKKDSSLGSFLVRQVQNVDKSEAGDDEEEGPDERSYSKKRLEYTRLVTIPVSIKHFLLIDPTTDMDEDDDARKKRDNIKVPERSIPGGRQKAPYVFSLSTRLSLLQKHYLSEQPWKKGLLFVPTIEDVVQTIFILKKFRTCKQICSLKTLLPRLLYNPKTEVTDLVESFFSCNPADPDTDEKKLIVLPFSGTRGLHIPNIDTVFIIKSPKNIDEYLHLAGRTGRLDCNQNWDQATPAETSTSSEKLESKVVTVVSGSDVRKMDAWQEMLDFRFSDLIV